MYAPGGRLASRRARPRLAAVRVGVVLLTALCSAALSAPANATYLRPGRTSLVTLTDEGGPAYAPLHTPAGAIVFTQHLCGGSDMTPDARYVVFSSAAPLVKEDRNLACDIYLRDRRKNATTRISVAQDGSEALPGPQDLIFHNTSIRPTISADGRFVAFMSLSPNLVPGDTNPNWDFFVHDRRKRTLERISVDSDEKESALPPCLPGCSEPMGGPSISADGRFVAFSSDQPGLVKGDDNETRDIFVRDLKAGTTERLAKDPLADSAWVDEPSISANGRYVVFTVGQKNVVVRDRQANKSTMASVLTDGSAPGLIDGDTYTRSEGGHQISNDGRFVTFVSNFNKFIPADNNWQPCMAGNLRATMPDVFVFDVKVKRMERVSVSSIGEEGPWGGGAGDSGGSCSGIHTGPSISGNGRFVAFGTLTNFTPEDDGSGCFMLQICLDGGGDRDGYVYDRSTGALTWLSGTFDGKKDANGSCSENELAEPVSSSTVTAVSGTGRYILISSCVENLAANDRNGQRDLFVRDIGPLVGAGSGDPVHPEPGEDELCIDRVCLPPLGVLSEGDAAERASLSSAADLIGARVAYRPSLGDVFVDLELQDLPLIRTGGASGSALASLVYGLRFTTGSHRYEVRASALGGGTFALFDCAGSLPVCAKVADLGGGFGTTGKRVVFSLPLRYLESGGVTEMEAFTAHGAVHIGAAKVIDRIAF